MKVYIMEGCPGCSQVLEKMKELKVEKKFTLIDIHKDYDGFIPEQVPALQDSAVGTIIGEAILDFLSKVYE